MGPLSVCAVSEAAAAGQFSETAQSFTTTSPSHATALFQRHASLHLSPKTRLFALAEAGPRTLHPRPRLELLLVCYIRSSTAPPRVPPSPCLRAHPNNRAANWCRCPLVSSPRTADQTRSIRARLGYTRPAPSCAFARLPSPGAATGSRFTAMYPQHHPAMPPPQQARSVAPETFLLDQEAQSSLPQDSVVALQQVDNRASPTNPQWMHSRPH